ncbi:MAG: TraB/GumN family protein [Amphiplicatus sp.]
MTLGQHNGARFGALMPVLAIALLAAPAAALAPEASPAARAHPPVWRLADEDSEIFIVGTFHILPPGLDWRSDALAKAADRAETYWFEAEVDTNEARQKTLEVMTREGFNKPGVTLANILGPDDAARLKTVAADVGLPMNVIDPMRPWQAFLAISVQFIVSEGFDPDSGVETVLLKEARARGRSLRYFESVEEQLALFTTLPPETEKQLLVVTLRDWEKQKADFDTLFAAWRDGDVETIDRLMNEAMRDEAPAVYDKLVIERNQSWAEEIAKAMAGSGRILVAVGAGHLVGEQSVPALLEAKGFAVERVRE